MELKIHLGFGRSGQHSLRVQNRNLETQVQALTTALEAANEQNQELREQLTAALSDRIEKGRRLRAADLMQGRLQLVPTEQDNRFKIISQRSDEG